MKPSRFIPRKGLKQYIPDQGWVTPGQEVDPAITAVASSLEPAPDAAALVPLEDFQDDGHSASPRPTFDSHLGEGLRDPLLGELLEQLHTPPTDELTDHWQRIAAEVSQLNQGMREQKRLREELATIEAQLLGLRSTILNDLHAVQRIADHQLVQARLRSEVSTLAQNRLATRLQHPPE